MKITLVTGKPNWHSEQLLKEAKKMKLNINVIDTVGSWDPVTIGKAYENMVILRLISPQAKKEVAIFRDFLDKGKTILNGSKKPLSGFKLYQQKFIENLKAAQTIPTFHFQSKSELEKSIADEKLSFPFIKKPDFGMQGNDISLLKKPTDLESIDEEVIEKYIFQPFIKNSGDFRVLVLGGKALGAIKRTAKKGSYLNNISQGGSAEKVTNKKILSELTDIAIRIASAFNLAFCGVDIIYDEKIKKYRFLEVNSAPEWKGFQSSTGIVVARKILEYCHGIHPESKISGYKKVQDCYENNFELLDKYRFHYASRMWLWTKNPKQKNRLAMLKNEYLNLEKGGPSEKIKNLLAEKPTQEKRIGDFTEREPYFKKYPKLYPYQRILFFNLFAKTIYDEKLSETIGKLVKEKGLIDTREKLLKDKRTILTLSTFAINFLYLSDFYLSGKKNHEKINPDFFLELCEQAYKKNPRVASKILYILSHCIIGESLFYSRRIKEGKPIYLAMIRLMEKIIAENYFGNNLDIKFEFLVCAKTLGYKTWLREIILNEGSHSLSPLGNFIVDMLNSDSKNPLKNHMLLAEHRNVLFLMANE